MSEPHAPSRELLSLVLSDVHLSDAEEHDPKRPHWKAYKRRRFFVDDDIARLLDWAKTQHQGPLELVLNGDIFDFDNITTFPAERTKDINWLGRVRGLTSESWMSAYKMERIIAEHPRFFDSLRDWLIAGNRLVFVLGNHDLELHWPDVQALIRARIGEPDGEAMRFCEWFYISGDDSFITHGHIFDSYCVTRSPIDPLIRVHGRPRIQIPFGDLANRYMLNGMGYFNPHATANYIMSLKEYVSFFLKYMLRTQPLLLWTWFWGAMVTLFVTLRDYLAPSMRDPLLVDDKVAKIARKAQAEPKMVRQLAALVEPSAATDPLKIARELWLDRGFLLLLMIAVAYQLVAAVNWVWRISPLWILVPLALLLPLFLMYSFKVRPQVFEDPLLNPQRAELLRQITGVSNAVMGHTHQPTLHQVGPLSFANGGFWSPAFAEPECVNRIGTQTFVLIRRGQSSEDHRALELWEWPPEAMAPKRYAQSEA